MEAERSVRMRVEDVAERLGISKPSVYRLLEGKQIPGIRIGRNWLITRYAFEAWEKTCGMNVQ